MQGKLVLKLTIDTNVINSKQRLPAMNKLEQLRDEGVLVLVGTERLKMEVAAYKNTQAAEKLKMIPNMSEPLVLSKSFVGSCYLPKAKTEDPEFRDLAEILFPKKNYLELTENDSNDVMHLMGHYFGKSDIFVTNNINDFIKDGRREHLMRRFGINVMTPDEAVFYLFSKFGK